MSDPEVKQTTETTFDSVKDSAKKENIKDETVNSNKPKKSGVGKIIFGLVIFLVLIFVFAGFGIYNYITTNNKIVNSLNTNINLNNELDKKQLALFGEIEAVSSNYLSTDEQESQQFTELKTKINLLVEDYSKAKEKLDKGPNKDTEEFKNFVQTGFDSSENSLKISKNFLELNSCLVDKGSKQVSYFTQAQKVQTEFVTKATPNEAEISSFVGSFKQLFSDIKSNSENVKKCFEGDSQVFLNPEITQRIDNYTNNVQKNMEEANKLMEEGLREKSPEKSLEGSNRLADLGNESSFFTQQNAEFVVNEAGKILETEMNKLLESSKNIQDKRQDIIKKYNLEEK